jgi:hypothetical protein
VTGDRAREQMTPEDVQALEAELADERAANEGLARENRQLREAFPDLEAIAAIVDKHAANERRLRAALERMASGEEWTAGRLRVAAREALEGGDG